MNALGGSITDPAGRTKPSWYLVATKDQMIPRGAHYLPEPDPSGNEVPAGARPGEPEPVTVLYSRRVKPGREADFETWALGILAAARQFPGHLRASVLGASGSRERHILLGFADPKSLRAWLDSKERRRWLIQVEELLEADRGLQRLTGLETWFKLPGANVPTMKPPPRWKMWPVSLVARGTVLSHAYLSYVFGVVIVAGSVNLIAGLLS